LCSTIDTIDHIGEIRWKTNAQIGDENCRRPAQSGAVTYGVCRLYPDCNPLITQLKFSIRILFKAAHCGRRMLEMSSFTKWKNTVIVAAGVLLTSGFTGLAQAGTIQTVFVIAMENHNWTQPGSQTSPGQIFANPAAPFINSLVTPGNPNAAQTSYAGNYQNAGTGIHPSEPNYIWAEAGSNLGVLNDNDPYGSGGTNQTTNQSLSNDLQNSGKSWRSYQEDADVNLTNNQPLSKSQYTVPLSSFSGTFTSGTNQYNGSNQYNYAAKHNPQVIFSSTNGGNNGTTSNPQAQNYAPLQQLSTDLTNNTVARYNWITPDQYNDMHTALTAGFTYNGVHYTGDQAAIAQGDSFLAQVVPQIEASQAYQNNGAIFIWWDESEGGDDPSRTIGEILISPDAKGNAYTNNIRYTHSSDLLTMQEIYGVGPCLLDACNATDLSDLFKAGSIPQGPLPTPEPSTFIVLIGLGGIIFGKRIARKQRV
jgi:phosphatidylinositol-3-phosphatase